MFSNVVKFDRFVCNDVGGFGKGEGEKIIRGEGGKKESYGEGKNRGR